MDFSRLFNVFSRREQPVAEANKPLTSEFRFRVLQLCMSTFPERGIFTRGGNLDTVFWIGMHEKLTYLHGRWNLSKLPFNSPGEDAINFLSNCNDDHFLDFLELIFQWQRLWESDVNPHQLVRDINDFLEADELPYSLTAFSFFDYIPPPIESCPKIIRRENTVVHNTAIEPTLILLSGTAYSSANEEFRGALTHYRKAEYADCLSKCGSSLESVMKVICNSKNWPYMQTDTASKLLGTILPKTRLDPFFKEPLTLIATIRNRLSSSHGAGTVQRVVPKQVAQYAINATASAILLLVEETNP